MTQCEPKDMAMFSRIQCRTFRKNEPYACCVAWVHSSQKKSPKLSSQCPYTAPFLN